MIDTFAFDKFWATVAPLEIAGNSTFIPPQYPTFFTTTQPKYLSTIPRDNIYRQFASLWFITVPPPLKSILLTIVDVWSHFILCIRFIVVLFRIRSNISLPSKIPSEPNPQRNDIDDVLFTTNGSIHGSLVSSRS